MLDSVLLLGFCSITGLLGLAFSGWIIVSGRLTTLDGILLLLISLLLGGLFLLNVAWSVRKGEVREILNYFRRGRTGPGASSEAPSS